MQENFFASSINGIVLTVLFDSCCLCFKSRCHAVLGSCEHGNFSWCVGARMCVYSTTVWPKYILCSQLNWKRAKVSEIRGEMLKTLLHRESLSVQLLRLDSNIISKSLNNTYLNIIKIFNKLFKKINIIESRNLEVTLTSKKGNFKCK